MILLAQRDANKIAQRIVEEQKNDSLIPDEKTLLIGAGNKDKTRGSWVNSGIVKQYEMVGSNNLVYFLKNRQQDDIFIMNQYGIYGIFENGDPLKFHNLGEFNP